MSAHETFGAVQACAERLIAGAVLHAADVTVGRGVVIDWRTVRSGETVQEGGDTFDAAQLFVALVGPDAALAACGVESEPTVTAFAPNHAGARRRAFNALGFRVYVEPHDDDDAAQEAFTRWLAGLTIGARP